MVRRLEVIPQTSLRARGPERRADQTQKRAGWFGSWERPRLQHLACARASSTVLETSKNGCLQPEHEKCFGKLHFGQPSFRGRYRKPEHLTKFMQLKGAAIHSTTGTRCSSQIAKNRRLSVYPDEFGSEQDICDVTLWLQGKFGIRSLHLWVDRHYTQIGHEVAGVTVMARPRSNQLLTLAAQEAFLALGYLIGIRPA